MAGILHTYDYMISIARVSAMSSDVERSSMRKAVHVARALDVDVGADDDEVLVAVGVIPVGLDDVAIAEVAEEDEEIAVDSITVV